MAFFSVFLKFMVLFDISQSVGKADEKGYTKSVNGQVAGWDGYCQNNVQEVIQTHLAVLSANFAKPVGSISTVCHPSSMITNFGEIPPFSKL